MSEPVSIIQWHDAHNDPPRAGWYLVNDTIDGVMEGHFNPQREPPWMYDGSRSHPTHWAHMPNIGAWLAEGWSTQPNKAPSGVTGDDVRAAVQALIDMFHMETQPYPDWAVGAARIDRLRAELQEEEA